jgi:hypothetical protein
MKVGPPKYETYGPGFPQFPQAVLYFQATHCLSGNIYILSLPVPRNGTREPKTTKLTKM